MGYVVVVTFDTSADNHVSAKHLLNEYIEGFLCQQDGFIESWLNEREDNGGYLHFARWEKESNFRAFAAKAKDHPLLPAIREFNGSAVFYNDVGHYRPQE
ncbi:MAG: hypothetical protein HQ497_01390 [SAR86 cluster bacterium]|jgi:hypothetical protein|uniref:Antibiotic biosynthesis monooxygenase n=1 Tax=SAR86 cluster bacterium TaxID=2030880 RepID=A0A972VTI8_9GAMM|nr:hypothetical protein [SAR86 cluster bacterium]|tara:strand:+ start:815 stop:1114 length:300 start_codon:yes stop_codon:yes gene_type:complete